MSKIKGLDNSTEKNVGMRSSYFQTEFSAPHKSDVSSGDEEVCALSEILKDLPFEGKPDTIRNPPQGFIPKKVSISVQTGRSIIGQEDFQPKERKRWIRPPGVGQASNAEDQNAIVPAGLVKESSSEDDAKHLPSFKRESSGEYARAAEFYQKRTDYINVKPMEGCSDLSLQQINDPIDFPHVISPSSASSATSKPLEWDSGADVGYFQDYGTVSKKDQEFSSTMERIALVQGRTGLLMRSDPEGTSSSKKGSTAINAIGLPTAESTLINFNSTESGSSKSQTTSKSSGGKQKYHPLFPEVIINYRGNNSDSSNEQLSPKSNVSLNCLQDPKLKKFSSSLENVSEMKSSEGQAATFPRSHSQSNLNSELEYNSHLKRILNPPQSLSSSSIATVISGLPRRNSKCIQTSYLKNDKGIQSSLSGTSIENHEEKKLKHNGCSTVESVHLSVDDRVNSFEYLPGHVYENNGKVSSKDFWEKNQGKSLQNDVERGVQIIEEFIQGSNANNTLMKKELLHRVVEKLIETDYPEDAALFKKASQCSSTRSQNREEVTGESSSEVNQPPGSKTLSNSTSLNDQSSSVFQSTCNSTKSSEKSSHHPLAKSHGGSGSSRRINKAVSRDKSTDLSTDSKSDWKEPLTRAEKLYEMKKKGYKKDDQLLEFINSERENQIDWIVKEINHLSNLKTLLEKHERLRKNLNRLKSAKSKGEVSPIKQNLVRPVGFKRRTQHIPASTKSMGSSLGMNRRPKLATLIEDKGWDSHNYGADSFGRLKRNVSTETRNENVSEGAKAVAYTITFDPEIKPQKVSKPEVRPIIADRKTLEKESRTRVREAFRQPSLQECLINKRPDVVTRAEVRRQTVAELAAIRQVREEQRPAILAAALNCDPASAGVPPVSLVKRVVSQKEMREQTERKYRKTFEVRKKISDQKLKETQRSNKLMAELFNKRLQLLTLKGKTNLSNSIDVISACN